MTRGFIRKATTMEASWRLAVAFGLIGAVGAFATALLLGLLALFRSPAGSAR